MDPNIPSRWHPLDFACAGGFLVYAASATITPICLVILARELAFSLTAAGLIEVARSLLIVLTLLGSGILAGRFGKVRSLGTSCLLLGAGLGCYATAPDYGVIVLAVAVLGGAGGVLEALINPLIQDTHPHSSGKYLSFVNAFWSIGVLLTMIIGGELLTVMISWRWLLAGLALCSTTAGLLFFALRKLDLAPRYNTGTALSHKAAVLRHPGFRLFAAMMVLAGAAEGALTFWSASLIQIQFDTAPKAGGWGAGCFAIGMIAGRLGGARWMEQQRIHPVLFASAAMGTLFTALIPWAGGVTAVSALLLLAGVSIACLWPGLQSYAVDRLRLDPTALFILLSCGGIPGFAAASWLVGWLGDRAGLAVGFLLVPACLTLLSLLLLFERRLRIRHPADS